MTAALNYAMDTYVGLVEMASARVTHGATYSILEYDTDSKQRRRSAPDYREAFAEAANIVEVGSIVRKTNRAGEGTTGTRRCQGIGKVGLKMEVYPGNPLV